MKLTFLTYIILLLTLLHYGCSVMEEDQDLEEIELDLEISNEEEEEGEEEEEEEEPVVTDCSKCDFFVSATEFGFDGEELGVKPGDIICLDGAVTYEKPLAFTNIKGTADNPVIITNCNGQAILDLPGRNYGIDTKYSEHFRITGTGDPSVEYGIVVKSVKGSGIGLSRLSTNFEVDHLEVYNVGFAGIMAKTDPDCDDETIRGNFTMRDVSIHHNYVHDTKGEGLYIGNSFYAGGVNTACGTRFPHEIIDLKVYSNILRNTGWEAVQVSAATQGAEVYDNDIENFGIGDRESQNNGLQLGSGTGGLCYNNRIVNGKGTGMIIFGTGDNVIFNNIIVNAEKNGVFIDERYTTGDGFKFLNNTIINPGLDGIRVFTNDIPRNYVANNLIVNPGNYDEFGDDAYINHRANTVVESNYFTRDITEVKFTDVNSNNFDLRNESPVIDAGIDVLNYGVTFDILGRSRPKGHAFDIGAYESQ